jgi:hypothetical protein
MRRSPSVSHSPHRNVLQRGSTSMKSPFQVLSLATVILFASACPAVAAEPHSAIFGGYWAGFMEHWTGVFQQQNGIAMTITGLGIVALFIITRGKWHK